MNDLKLFCLSFDRCYNTSDVFLSMRHRILSRRPGRFLAVWFVAPCPCSQRIFNSYTFQARGRPLPVALSIFPVEIFMFEKTALASVVTRVSWYQQLLESLKNRETNSCAT